MNSNPALLPDKLLPDLLDAEDTVAVYNEDRETVDEDVYCFVEAAKI